MKSQEVQNMEQGLAITQRFAAQQFRSSVAMVASAGLAFFVTVVLAPEISGLGLSIAAATGLSVGVWSQPNAYLRSNGSLKLAIALIAAMWTGPVIVLFTSLFS